MVKFNLLQFYYSYALIETIQSINQSSQIPIEYPIVPLAPPPSQPISNLESQSTKNNDSSPEIDLNVYMSNNHSHSFRKKPKTHWICDGYQIYGSCKSKIDDYEKGLNFVRFKCNVCKS
jgi:hypothetical protein